MAAHYLIYQRQAQQQLLHFYGQNLCALTSQLRGPTYVYDWRQSQARATHFLQAAKDAGAPAPLVCYALKANAHPELLKSFIQAGLGFDVVSGGELALALKAGADPQTIVFSGVGKTADEIEQALRCGSRGIYAFNVESASEARLIAQIAQRLKRRARLSFRLNPHVKAMTHKHIATGDGEHKFGISAKEILQLCKSFLTHDSVELVGLSMHIGSQLRDFKATRQALGQLSELVRQSKLTWEFIDVGGGLGINYHHQDQDTAYPTFEDYHLTLMRKLVKEFPVAYPFQRLVYEPGRCLVAPCGILLAQVLYLKKSGPTQFAILNAGMTDLIRPSLYDAYHEIYPLLKRPGRKVAYDVVGPVCESTDMLAKKRLLTPLQEGDWVAIADTGAYGQSMSSTYNQRPLPQELVLP